MSGSQVVFCEVDQSNGRVAGFLSVNNCDGPVWIYKVATLILARLTFVGDGNV